MFWRTKTPVNVPRLLRSFAAAILLAASLAQCAGRPVATGLRPEVAGVQSPSPREQVAEQPAPPELSPRVTRERLMVVTPPMRDEADLVRRYKQTCGTPAARALSLFRDDPAGDARPFWVLDEPNHRFFQVQATLRYASTHLELYLQDGVQIAAEALAASARVFEEKSYPILRQYFGDLPEEPRITVFSGRVPGVGGYFSASDLFPREVNPYSNERVMVYMNLDEARPGSAGFDSILAHESQHFVHWVVHPQQDSWINEGASELAMTVAGYDRGQRARSFLSAPETQLNGWAERPAQTLPHYGAGYLFLEYLSQRLGGYEYLKELIATPGVSVGAMERYLAPRYPGGFDAVFGEFVLANLLNDRSIADGRFGYQRIAGRARIQESRGLFPAATTGRLQPYATNYVEYQPGGRRGTLEVRFDGAAAVALYAGTPHSGQAQWWGNAADEMESTLTREVDLTAVDSATLRFSAWFNAEKDYDYAGVAVSSDTGCTWRTLPGRYTTDTDPVGQNLGHGLTGRSGGGDVPVWVDESMDLSAFAGQKVLLRFFYVTDQSYHGSGFAVDDVSIPEIDFSDDAESDTGWQATGFIRSMNAAALDWAVQAVAFGDNGTQISRLALQPNASGDRLTGSLYVPQFGDAVKRVVVAVSPLLPVTLEPAEYRLQADLP